MSSLADVMGELEKRGSEQTRRTYARHGIDLPMFGVSVANLKLIANSIKGDQELALELYKTGNYDAMYLAGIVADGKQMSKKQIDQWAKSAGCPTIAGYTVPWVAVESPHAHALAMTWINSRNATLAVCGWSTFAGLVAMRPDNELDLDEIQELLTRVEREIHQAPNRVRYAMNGFVIAVGGYVAPLLKPAKKAAAKIGVVSVDMGRTACKVPAATAYIAKIEALGRVGKKRKTLRC